MRTSKTFKVLAFLLCWAAMGSFSSILADEDDVFRLGIHGGLALPPSGVDSKLSSGFGVSLWGESSLSMLYDINAPHFLLQYSLSYRSYSNNVSYAASVSQLIPGIAAGYEFSLPYSISAIPSIGYSIAFFSGDDFADESLPFAGILQVNARFDYTLPWLESSLRPGFLFQYQFEFPGVSTLYFGLHVLYNFNL